MNSRNAGVTPTERFAYARHEEPKVCYCFLAHAGCIACNACLRRAPEPRGDKRYCSNACRQAAYRRLRAFRQSLP